MVLPFTSNAMEACVDGETGSRGLDPKLSSNVIEIRSASAPVRPTLSDLYERPDDSNSPRKRFHPEQDDDKLREHSNNAQRTCDTNNNNDSDLANLSTKLAPRHGELNVIKAKEWHRDPEEDYKMSSRTRGLCLIINNVQFELDCFAQRKGSDKDAFRLKEIYKQLGFEVACKRNLTSEKMKKAFKHQAAMCMSKHDALVVILLSHGSESGIYGTDGIEVDLNDILSHFDNKKCKPMRGKPKVFIVQACRGRNVDYGVGDSQVFFTQPESQPYYQQSQLTQQNSQCTRLPRWSTYDKDHNPIRTDMLLCFSSQVGFVSNRNEEEGSWLGASLAWHLVHEAHRRHIIEILNMVSRDVRSLRSNDGLKQVLEITTIGFDRNLYFNPGLNE